MSYYPYTRVNQQIIDGTIAGISFYLAFVIRFEGVIPPYHQHQFWLMLVPLIAGRLLTNFLFGLHLIPWRYVGFRDASRVCQAYAAFSGFLLLARIFLPARAEILRIPVSVITIELMLCVLGAMAVRLLRRHIAEYQSPRVAQAQAKRPRRLLLIGAGMKGANVAKEMASDSAVEIVGFLDDNPYKIGSVIAGVRVLGTTSSLTQVVRERKIDDVLVCINPAERGSFNRLMALLESLPVTSKFVPTVTEILNSKEDLHAISDRPRENGHGARISSAQTLAPEQGNEIRNKTILITGGAGFIGSSLAERFASDNHVVLLDRLFQNQPIAFTSLHKNPNVRFVETDILEGAGVDDWAREANVVIHAAAIVGVGRVCSYPRETLETNFGGTLRILKALEKSPRLERFVYFSTSEVFGVNSFRVHEHTPAAVGPAAEARWSYAIAKLAGEHLVKAYHRQTGMPVVTVRPFNVFGPRRLGAHAILGFALNALTGNPIEVHGDGSQIRSWCYIDDFCDAIIEMIARPRAVGEDFNIGNPSNTLTIFRLAQQVVELIGTSVPIVFKPSPFPDIEIRVPSLDKAREILGFQPAYDLYRALELTTQWYKHNLDFFEARLPRMATAVGAH